MKETMNIHKALATLKILDKKLADSVDFKVVVANKHNNQKIDGVTIGEFINRGRENMQSYKTLVNRRNAIKRAVTKSNACTVVNISGKDYTVAEAIDMKAQGTQFLEKLLASVNEQYQLAVRTAERENGQRLEERADSYVASLYGNSDMKNLSDEVKKVRDTFIASQSFDVVDAIDCTKFMAELRKEIDDFMADVDSALSVSNALTVIDVEYETC